MARPPLSPLAFSAPAGTFTRAAERLLIAQPTLSQQIGQLEKIVGTRLLHRRRDAEARLEAAVAGAARVRAKMAQAVSWPPCTAPPW